MNLLIFIACAIAPSPRERVFDGDATIDTGDPRPVDLAVEGAVTAEAPAGGGLVVCSWTRTTDPPSAWVLPDLVGSEPIAEGGLDVTGLLGDVDGDGVEEWLGRSVPEEWEESRVLVFSGDATGALDAASARATLGGTWAEGGTDLDGDTIPDLVLVSGLDTSWGPELRLYSGAGTGDLDAAGPVATIVFPEEDRHFAQGVGDVDGDGFGDLVFGRENVETDESDADSIHLLLGPVVGDVSAETATALGMASGYARSLLFGAPGDIDGDGVDDFVAFAGHRGGKQVDVYTDGGRYRGSYAYDGITSGSDTAVGDFDGDGLGDVAVLVETGSSWDDPNEAWILHGPLTSGTVEADGTRVQGPTQMLSAGDADHDGIDDLFSGYSDTEGATSTLFVTLGPL